MAVRNGGGARVFTGATVTGATTIIYSVGALPAGACTFFCTVYTFMTGSLTVH